MTQKKLAEIGSTESLPGESGGLFFYEGRHPRVGGDPTVSCEIPAYAGMTNA